MRFAAGERGSGLAELQITKPDIQQRVQFVGNARHIPEKSRRFVYGEIENVRNIFSFVSNLERLSVIAPPVANFALHINIRQEMHLDLD